MDKKKEQTKPESATAYEAAQNETRLVLLALDHFNNAILGGSEKEAARIEFELGSG
jgi:hypothetical protein